MKTVFLHIGTFKTGTKSIQKFLDDNRERLKSMGYLVPSSQRIGHHELPLSVIFDYTDFRPVWPSFEGDSETLWTRLVDEIDASDAEYAVISSEAFCDFAHESAKPGLQRFKEHLQKYLGKYNVKVVCYVRSIIPYSLSMYKETLKTRDLKQTYYEQLQSNLKRHSFHLFPTAYLDFFADVFGRQNLILRKYERGALLNGSSVDDFLDAIGIKAFGETSDAVEKNMSLDDSVVDLKRAVNLVGFKELDFNRKLSSLLIQHQEDAKHTGLDPALEHKILGAISEEYEKLNETYGIAFDTKMELPDIHGGYSASELFQISLIAMVLKQNRQLAARLNALEQGGNGGKPLLNPDGLLSKALRRVRAMIQRR